MFVQNCNEKISKPCNRCKTQASYRGCITAMLTAEPLVAF